MRVPDEKLTFEYPWENYLCRVNRCVKCFIGRMYNRVGIIWLQNGNIKFTVSSAYRDYVKIGEFYKL